MCARNCVLQGTWNSSTKFVEGRYKVYVTVASKARKGDKPTFTFGCEYAISTTTTTNNNNNIQYCYTTFNMRCNLCHKLKLQNSCNGT